LIPRAAAGGSRGEIDRDYSAGTSVKHFQIFFQCVTEKREPPRGGIRTDMSDERFVQLGEVLFGGTP